MPRLRAESERLRAQVRDNMPTAIRCTGALLWLTLPSALLGILGGIDQINAIPALYWIVHVCSILCIIAEGIIYIRLRAVNQHFLAATMSAYSVALISFIRVAMTAAAVDSLFVNPLAQVSMIFDAVEGYCVCTSFAEILAGIDDALAIKWRRLWKVYVGAIISMDLVEGIVYAAPGVALLLVFAVFAALVAVAVLEPIYLWRTRKAFCKLTAQSNPNA